jgi:phosphatidylglycerol---prolipoprotein diacylglyceryl transferase
VLLAAISYDPIVHVPIGPLRISPHGVGIAVGFLLGARLMLPAAHKRGITDDDVYALLTRAAIGAIIGARLAYVINHMGDYGSPLEVIQVWKGGISLLGGFTGAILLALPEMRKRRLSFWKVMDAAAPGMALGVIVGRIGDLIVGDHLGTATTFFLGYRCPPATVDTASPCVAPIVHQTALYDLILTTVLLTVLLLVRRKPRWDGFIILTFGVLYGIQRLIEDFLREDVRRLGLTGSQWTAVTAMALCLFVLGVRGRTPAWGRWDERGAVGPEPPGDGPSMPEPEIEAAPEEQPMHEEP